MLTAQGSLGPVTTCSSKLLPVSKAFSQHPSTSRSSSLSHAYACLAGTQEAHVELWRQTELAQRWF